METNSFALSTFDRLRSKRNRLFFALRKQIAFTRHGYKEGSVAHTLTSWEQTLPRSSLELVQSLCKKYAFDANREKLSLESWQKNLATLWILDRFPELLSHSPMQILEAGAQDFQRAPALAAFLRSRGSGISLLGLELDAYRILQDFHSRFDKASYFASLAQGASFQAADFFEYHCPKPADLILAFYPFVSPHPALAWGLPSEYGSADAWIRACIRLTAPGAEVFMLHQGKWEEEEFQEALARSKGELLLVKAAVLECPFYPTPHPMYASLYTRRLPC